MLILNVPLEQEGIPQEYKFKITYSHSFTTNPNVTVYFSFSNFENLYLLSNYLLLKDGITNKTFNLSTDQLDVASINFQINNDVSFQTININSNIIGQIYLTTIRYPNKTGQITLGNVIKFYPDVENSIIFHLVVDEE